MPDKFSTTAHLLVSTREYSTINEIKWNVTMDTR